LDAVCYFEQAHGVTVTVEQQDPDFHDARDEQRGQEKSCRVLAVDAEKSTLPFAHNRVNDLQKALIKQQAVGGWSELSEPFDVPFLLLLHRQVSGRILVTSGHHGNRSSGSAVREARFCFLG
jgi:hypothetical protein